MAAVASSGTPSIASVTNQLNSLSGLIAGEAISAGMPCYIKASDGKVYKSNGTSANEAAAVHGWAAQAASAGEAVTLVWDVRIRYGAGMTPGTKLYVATTAGTLVDAATTGGTAPVGFVVDATRIHVWQSRY
jgi:hypothetical protein